MENRKKRNGNFQIVAVCTGCRRRGMIIPYMYLFGNGLQSMGDGRKVSSAVGQEMRDSRDKSFYMKYVNRITIVGLFQFNCIMALCGEYRCG